METTNAVLNSLEKGNKVSLVHGNYFNTYEGFIVNINEVSITINIYVPDLEKTFQRNEIIEIEKI